MQRIDLRPALAMILETDPDRQPEQLGKALAQSRIGGGLAANVADHPAQSGAQEFELAPRPLELVRVGVAPDHERRPLGHARIALAQRHTVAARQRDQFLQCPVTQPRIGRMGDRFGLHRGVDHHPLEVTRCYGAGLVRHRQALLNQSHQLLLAQPLAPMGQ